jgi:hypothetical protein
MRLILLSLAVATSGAWAKGVDLKDPSILGLYKLEKPDRKSDLQEVEIVYNNNNELVARVDRNDQEYTLDAAQAGVIFEGEDEPNCGGEEQQCWYDSSTVISLEKSRDGWRMTIKIVQSDAWDESGKTDETKTWKLLWEKELDYAIPYYLNIPTPAGLEKLVKSCNARLKDIEYEDGAGYLNENDICPFPRSVQLRDPFEKALKFYLKYEVSQKRKLEQVTPAQLKTKVFNRARALAAKYKPKDKKSPSRQDVVEQIDLIEQYASKADILYTFPHLRDGEIIMVDTKTKTISKFGIKVTDKYPN